METAPTPAPAGKTVSIIVPTYKEAENLPPLIERVNEAMSACEAEWELVVVDDDSQDGSDQVIAEFASKGLPVRLITRVGQRGLSSAVIEGFNQARGERLVCMDADLSHPPEAVCSLLECMEREGADFVIGSRYVPGAGTDESWGAFRWLNSKVATLLARPFTNARDPMAGFFALPREVFARAGMLNPIGYKIALELIVKCRCRNIREVPIHFANRQFGASKLSLRQQINYIKHLKRLADFKFGWFSKLFQFCIVGGTGTIVDLVTYAALLDFVAHPIAGAVSAPDKVGNPLEDAARVLAILVAMTWNFFFNRRLTYSHTRGTKILPQYWRFVMACSLGALVSLFISRILPRVIGFFRDHLLAAAVVGILVGLVINFTLSHKWVFRRLHGGKSGEGN